MDNELQKSHSCSSSTCNGWRNEKCNVIFRGGGVFTIDGVSPLCLCGEKTVVRTARTAKNRGKQFWGCPKYKNGHEGGCNFFKWCCDDAKKMTVAVEEGREKRSVAATMEVAFWCWWRDEEDGGQKIDDELAIGLAMMAFRGAGLWLTAIVVRRRRHMERWWLTRSSRGRW
ncbi:hypothetical protein LR48_Vigan511s011300 [Vigna angularis]|uniref:GRF-type domain-containing protein n=1 Tax=Phaseolus angularis TaxID=3914 RepID=A0A0L9TCE7_PHAAN|nr:hypothetical protein LR48_Vigan511s011300 [Vigna angularis]